MIRIDSEFDNLNGIEVTLQFYSMFKGQQITFPMNLLNKIYIIFLIPI